MHPHLTRNVNRQEKVDLNAKRHLIYVKRWTHLPLFANPSSPLPFPLSSSPFSLDSEWLREWFKEGVTPHHLHLLHPLLISSRFGRGAWKSSLSSTLTSKHQRGFLSKGCHWGKCTLIYRFYACIVHIHWFRKLCCFHWRLGYVFLDLIWLNERVWSVFMDVGIEELP